MSSSGAPGGEAVEGARFQPRGQGDLAPSGEVARVNANIAALRTLRRIQAEQRSAFPAEQAVLARWSGWGAVPAVFDAKAAAYERFESARGELRELLSPAEYAAAERSVINAHYTDATYVQGIWEALARLGFEGGTVLEPGCGSGAFLGFAPEKAKVVGVELEPVTAGIAAALYPSAEIRNESFAETRLAEGSVDLVVGNVPFGNVVLHDRRHNGGQHAIHNHFIIKSLHLTRPGGLVAVVTSRYTMDAANPGARREMEELADLLGAVRLPSGAHRRAAGTDVVTDVLVFRRREEGREPGGAAFEQSRAVEVGGRAELAEGVRINDYFLAHPGHVLGELRLEQGELGRPELVVAGDRNAGPQLARALGEVVSKAQALGLGMAKRERPAASAAVALVAPLAGRPDGYLSAEPGGGFTRVESGQAVRHEPPASQARDLRALLGLRDTVVALLEAEAGSVDDSEAMHGLRSELNRRYDEYVRSFGPINRFSWRRTGRLDPGTGEEKLARVAPPQGGFRADPFANVVYALEHFEASTQTATKATIFRERVVARKAPRLGADTPADALAICLDSYGEVRVPEIARLLGVEPGEARAQLGELVFTDSETERVVPAAEYLSGNVREKLQRARAAAEHDAEYAVNVRALTRVLPRDLGPDEIEARLGAAWIGAEHVRQFLSEILDDKSVAVEHPGGAMWAVRSSYGGSVLATSRWGTERYSAIDIAQALLEQRQIRIYDEDEEGNRVFNATATVAAVEKAEEMAARFAEWVWEEPGRATTLARVYNDQFNAIVPRSYDDVKLSLPGLARSFRPLPHQVAAVARIIHEPAVGLFHEVGAGKTAEMVMGAMELRRLGLASKPAIVVPNHMLEQFAREWLQLYPQAKLLAASKEDLERDRRRLFVARCATGDWDGIVMTRSAFERIPMSTEVQREYLSREVEAIGAMLERAKASDARFSVKRLERMKLQGEERLKAKLDGVKDPGITFEETGIDYLCVDEAHAYKNLRTMSHIPGMAVDGSQRASDLHMKIEYLRGRGPRVATLATATPIANSMGEAFTMQRYLRPDLLEAAGVKDFDVWAATFGQTTTAIEVAPDGSGLRMQTRFSKFRNVPELLLQWRVAADIKTGEDLKLPIPALAPRASDGQRLPTTVVVPGSDELKTYVAELARRAERVRGGMVDPSEDNFLRISSDGRAAALDLRLVGQATSAAQKVTVAAERIAGIYHERRSDVFPGADGEPHPTPGALQLVFSDLGTPRPGEWSVYEQLRGELVERGVPREAIRFVHEAQNDRQKAELFAACRDGRVAVLLGSTERAGVGTNVQLRAAALHHLDCPWRPADLAQREGRILRQGNANPDVEMFRYVTEGSFDGYLWQTVARKAKFIGEVMRGRLDVREIEDIGETALSYNEVKALATGNPLLLEQAQVQAEVKRLERLERSHAQTQQTLRWTVREMELRLGRVEERIAGIEKANAQRALAAREPFSMTLGSRRFDKRAEADEVLRRMLAAQLAGDERPVELGQLRGFPIVATRHREGRGVTVGLGGLADLEVSLSTAELAKALPVSRLEHRIAGLETARSNAVAERERLRAERDRASAEIGRVFRREAELEAARSRLGQLNEQVAALAGAAGASKEAPAISVAKEKEGARGRGAPEHAEREAEGARLEAAWAAACARELAEVRKRAESIRRRLLKAWERQRGRCTEHEVARPKRPHVLARALGARTRYEAAVEAWAGEHRALACRERQLERRVKAMAEYAKEPLPGYPTKGTELARRRVERAEPELATQVGDFRRWREERIARELQSRRSREREGRALER